MNFCDNIESLVSEAKSDLDDVENEGPRQV
jgi:hypothetical protein